MVVIGFPGSESLAKMVARRSRQKYSRISLRQFPDGESHLKFDACVKNQKVILVQSLFRPNEKILDLLFAAHTARDLGAKSVWLVAPYMAYMRQDKRFFSGECVSVRVISKLFSVFDKVITIDPHLHRIHSLNEIFVRGVRLSANSLLAEHIRKEYREATIIGPDEESFQWARKIADSIGAKAIVLRKKRFSSEKVKIRICERVDFGNRPVVIVDDIISTGHTMIETVKEAKRLGAKSVICMCVHGIFADGADRRLMKAGAKSVICTNTIPGRLALIDVAGLISKAL